MKQALLALAAALVPHLAMADGLPLKDGRFVGSVIDMSLTTHQKQIIEQYRTCQLEHSSSMNGYTPYIFSLTAPQASAVKKVAGYAPSTFQVYETVRGFNDAGPHWNLALRYSEDRFEIPVALLLTDKAARAAHKEQGWKLENPCFPRHSK